MKTIDTQISLFRPALLDGKYLMGTAPETVSLAYALSADHQPDLLRQIRDAKDIETQRGLKKGLWAITPSAVCDGGRKSANIVSHTGLMSFDLDKLVDHPLNVYMSVLAEIDYILYLGRSASGNGLWGLTRIAYPDKHASHFDAMAQCFARIGIEIDPAPRAVNSLRFLAYDAEAHWNLNAKTFDLLAEGIKPGQAPKPQKGRITKSMPVENPWRNFNANAEFDIIHDILLNAGWRHHSTKGERVRYTRPHKDTRAGLSADYHTGLRTFYVFSSEAPAAEYFIRKKGGSASDVLLHYAANGDSKLAYRLLKELNY